MPLEGHMSESGVGLEPRMARIETEVVNLGPTFLRLEQKIDRLGGKIEDRFDKVERRFDKLDERFEKVHQRFEKVDQRFKNVDEQFEQVDQRFSALDEAVAGMAADLVHLKEGQARLHTDLRDLLRSLDSKFIWIVTTLLALGGALLGVMAHGFHWLS